MRGVPRHREGPHARESPPGALLHRVGLARHGCDVALQRTALLQHLGECFAQFVSGSLAVGQVPRRVCDRRRPPFGSRDEIVHGVWRRLAQSRGTTYDEELGVWLKEAIQSIASTLALAIPAGVHARGSDMLRVTLRASGGESEIASRDGASTFEHGVGSI